MTRELELEWCGCPRTDSGDCCKYAAALRAERKAIAVVASLTAELEAAKQESVLNGHRADVLSVTAEGIAERYEALKSDLQASRKALREIANMEHGSQPWYGPVDIARAALSGTERGEDFVPINGERTPPAADGGEGERGEK